MSSEPLNIKVAENAPHRIFFALAKPVSYCSYYISTIKRIDIQFVFELLAVKA